jgi:nitroreductase
MEFFDVVKGRHSVRAYKKKSVEEEKLQKILEAANSAPSAGNLQGYEIAVIEDEQIKKKVAIAALEQEFVAEAAVVLVFFADPDRSARKYGSRGRRLYCLQDATIAAAYAQLAAAELGIGCCWVGAFQEEELKKALNLSENLLPVAILPLGYSDEEPDIKKRRSLKDIARRIR